MSAPNMNSHMAELDATVARHRAIIAGLDCAADPGAATDVYLELARTLQTSAEYLPEGAPQEAAAERLIGVIDATRFLAEQAGDPLRRAIADEQMSYTLAARFRGDRDRHLLDAIVVGERALDGFRRANATGEERYGALQVHVGNCYVRLDGPRKRWLEAAVAAYDDGLACTDATRFPRLAELLAGNGEMARAKLAHRDGSLPEKEVYARLAALLQASLDRSDVNGARAACWRMIAWGWSLPETPNVWIAEAHKLLGGLELHVGDPGQAQVHFYCAVAVLSLGASVGDPRHAALLGGAQASLAECLERLNQPELVERLMGIAATAFERSRGETRAGASLISQDVAAARQHFEHALALFPLDPTALFYRGVTAMHMRDLQAALRDFDLAIQVKGDSVAALVNRGTIKFASGDVAGARADFDAVLEIDPENEAALRNREALPA
jgi:tetratricopeptide (TPR) repeat protein